MEGGEEQKNPTLSKVGEEEKAPQSSGGGGWGGWRFSVLSDLQKAAEEISRNAVEVAKSAAKGISELQIADSDSESAEEDGTSKESLVEDKPEEDEDDKIRKVALEKLEKASEDSLLGQGLKVLDSSVETLASGAWNALGSAWRGGTDLVQKLEHSAVNLAESIQHGNLPEKAGTLAPSIVESGKLITAKGMEVLERVSKETMELLISETGLDIENSTAEAGLLPDEQFEEVTFDRCFYIYGGPDHLEELEALSNHYALLFNRRKAKLSSEQKSFYDGKLREVQQIFTLGTEVEEGNSDTDKGKTVETTEESDGNELKTLRDASVSKAADMAAGFATVLGGLAANEVTQRTENRLEGIHSEGMHRLSEMCCFAVSQLVMIGKSIISKANKSQNEDAEDDPIKIDWPEDPVSKAKIIRSKAKSMNGDVGTVSNSFITGISDIIEAFTAAMQGLSSGDQDSDHPTEDCVQEKGLAISELLRAGQMSALEKIQDALQYLSYVVLSTSMPTA